MDHEDSVLLHVNSDESWYCDPTRPFELVEETVTTSTGLATIHNETFSAASAAPAAAPPAVFHGMAPGHHGVIDLLDTPLQAVSVTYEEI